MSIFNPIAFIGEYILGATPGAPLAQDSNGQLISGLSVIELTATADATTTSNTPALLTGMTVTPAAGTYMTWFSSSTQSNGTNCTQTFAMYVGGTIKSDSSRTIQPYDGGTLAAATATGSIAINGYITVTGSQTVEIHWSTAGGTATCHQRTLNLLRIT